MGMTASLRHGFVVKIKMAEGLRSDRLIFPNSGYLMILSLIMLT
ncbi:hypothetical protein [Nitrosospira sp. NRS527]|nr:hypothetical protein [Nitrosospira sp. NRS527]BCT67644.1 hypothetical protein NNRS527_01231 [Nitrosospira sp. NRS527]